LGAPIFLQVTAPDLTDSLTGQSITFIERAEDTGGERLTARVRLESGGFVPLHVHARQDERVEVVSGSVLVEVRGKAVHLEKGESVAVPRRHRHVVRNAGAGSTEFLLEVRPARHMEQAMRALFVLLRRVRPLVERFRRRRAATGQSRGRGGV
jgi:mannose-6-phosphate isomerase-like protein (cupin superfamily)